MASADHSIASAFDKLRRELDGCLAEVLELARSAAGSTALAWRAVVDATTGQPPSALPPAGNGANPAEVRSVLLALRGRFDRRLQIVERAMQQHEVSDEVADAIWTFRHRRLDSFVDEALAAHINTVTPRPSVGGVFAKAANLARSNPAPAVTGVSTVQLHRCKTCAAPRLGDGLYGDCLYCGNPLFTGREEIR